MTICEGSVVLVRFPFSDIDSSKKRPALIICTSELGKVSKLLVVAMISSRVDGLAIVGDVKLKDWKHACLLRPSLVRLAKLATIDDVLVDKELGRISDSDFKRVSGAFRKQFKNWL